MEAGWIAPKLYFLEYIEKKNGVEQIKYHLKGKWIPKDQLSLEAFETMMEGRTVQIQASRDFKRIHVNRNTQQQQCENFSIAKLDVLTKTINKKGWNGRHFIGNASVPFYHHSTRWMASTWLLFLQCKRTSWLRWREVTNQQNLSPHIHTHSLHSFNSIE